MILLSLQTCSDWGFDFRPDYRQAGIRIRSHPKLSQVPLMALTATAMPRIQQDILETLHMHQNVVKCLQSFDRTNLAIQVRSRDGGVRSAMEPLVQELLNRKPGSASSLPSTIVYCPTKAQVEEVAGFLQQRLQGSNTTTTTTTATPLVEYYHAGLSTERRKETHLRFLTGQTTVVVATIAFGMGIDKPDTRKVIHYGPPKTVEEYYQQIGRAGRDGLPSECILYCSMADFDRYKSDFYLQGLNPKARAATEQSTAALKGFAMSRDKCRRKSLLEFFQERPAFGDFCGTCDVCQTRKEFGEDTLRDFGPAVRFILSGIIVLKEQGMTTLLQVLSGQVLESYRYTLEAQQQATGLAKGFLAQRKALETRLTNEQIKEFIPSLIQKGHIHETTIQKKVAGYSRSWTVFGLSESGKSLLMNPSRKEDPVYLTVPQSIREAEHQANLRRQRVLEQLEAAGVELAKLPPKEIEDGDGEVIQAYLKWNRRLEALEKSGNTERLTQVQELLQVIQSWRSKTATELQMAPSNVLAEHLLFGIAYTAQSLHGGMKMSPSDLQQVGARNQKIASLAQNINDWLGKYQLTNLGTSGDDGEAMVLQFPPGKIQGTKWPYAVYRPNKKTGLASWESSYNRFAKGESPTSIAMAPSSGKPLAVTTVIGHVVEAAVQGKPVDLSRLASFAVGGTLPTKNRWAQLEEAEAELQMSVAGNPEMSGKDGGKYYMTDLLQPIMGRDFADKPRESRTEEEKANFSSWCETLKWYTLVKRTGMSPQFAKQS